MDILINNPISNMYGFYFLLFYGVVIVATGIGCKVILQGNSFDSKIEIPAKLDPYEVAYLRDGETAVAKVVCLELIQKGFVRVKNKRIERSPQLYNVSSLKPIEKTFFDWVENSRVASDVKYNFELKKTLSEHCEVYKKSLVNYGYLNSEQKSYLVGGVGASIILSLGSYKLIAALSRGHHNVMFLIFMAIAATIWIGYTSHPFYSRITAKGKQYLDSLKETFLGLTGNLQAPPIEPDYNSSLLVSIFDLDNFKVSGDYQDFVDLFVYKPTYTSSSNYSTSSSSGCGTSVSCGSSCSSGSSCGGGCGGCGGCGG